MLVVSRVNQNRSNLPSNIFQATFSYPPRPHNKISFGSNLSNQNEGCKLCLVPLTLLNGNTSNPQYLLYLNLFGFGRVSPMPVWD